MKTRKGEAPVVSTVLANAVDILRSRCALVGPYPFDQFAERLTVIDPPWHCARCRRGGGWEAFEWTDSDDARLQSWLTREYGVEFHFDMPRCGGSGGGKSRVCTGEGAPSMRWSGWWDRCCHLFSEYFGATGNEEYLAAISVRWLVSAVARIYDPGWAKVDTRCRFWKVRRVAEVIGVTRAWWGGFQRYAAPYR